MLVTGAGGFVGATLTRRLLADGHELHALERPDGSSWRLDQIRDEIGCVALDLRNDDSVASFVGRVRPDWIFHLAAYGAYSWQTDRHRMVETNIAATAQLLGTSARLEVEAFVQAGSSSEYGFQPAPPPEEKPLEPNSDYAVTKAAASLYAGFVARSTGLRTATLRLYSAYGPWEEPGRLIPTLIVHGLRGELPPLVNPDVGRDFVYVDDVADAFVLAATAAAPGAVYNVGTGVQHSISDVVEVARACLDVSAEPAWGSMPDRSWDTSVWVSDSRRIRRDLGWEPRVDLQEGFSRTVDWLRSAVDLWPRYGVELRDASVRPAEPAGRARGGSRRS